MEKLGVLISYFGLLFRRLRSTKIPPASSAKAAAPVVASISGTGATLAKADLPALKSSIVDPITDFILSCDYR